MEPHEPKRTWVARARAFIWEHKLVSALILLLLFLLGLPIEERVRGSISLHRYIGMLQAQGEIINPADFKLPQGTGRNGAPEVMADAKTLTPGLVLPRRYSPGMHLTAAGHAIVFFREDQWVEDNATNTWDQVAQDLSPNEDTLAQIRAAMAQRLLDSGIDPSQGPRARFQDLPVPKTLATWFGASVALTLHRGRTREALPNLLTEIDLPKLLARDRIVISELVRIAVSAIAKNGTWQALQADGWADADLVRIQRAWEQPEFLSAMERALEGERVFASSTYRLMRQSNQETASILFGLDEFAPPEDRAWWERTADALPGGGVAADFLKKQVYCRLWRFTWLDQDELHYLKFLQHLIAFSRDCCREKSFQALEPRLEALCLKSQNHGYYDRLRYPSVMSVNSLSRVLSRALRAETDRSLVVVAIALKRYALRHGAPPSSLTSLVPEFLPALPIDYMDGQPLKYRLQPDGQFLLYSVGEDGKDDGGDSSLRPGQTNLRIAWDRKDVVWPTPANTNELLLYRAEQLKR
jgi:uncharacterized protein YerC